MLKATSFVVVCILSVVGVRYCQGCVQLNLRSNVMATVPTPFDKDENLDVSMIPKMADNFRKINITSLFLTAYYGGGPSMSLQERKDVVKAWVDEESFDLVIGIGAMPFVDILDFASYCSQYNVSAFAAFSEIVYQPEDRSELMEDLERICSAAPNVPLLYHELTVVDQNLGPATSALVASKVSCAAGGMMSVNANLRYRASTSADDCQFIADTHDSIGAAYLTQMYAATSPTTNSAPGLHRDMSAAAAAGDAEEVMRLQQRNDDCTRAVVGLKKGEVMDDTSRDYFRKMKFWYYITSGIDTGYRYPLIPLNSTEQNEMCSRLAALGDGYCY